MPNHHIIDFNGFSFNILQNPVLKCMGMFTDIGGYTVPIHAHDDTVEVIYVLEGEGIVSIDQNEYPLRPGYIAIYNTGVYHHETFWTTNERTKFFHCKFNELRVSQLPVDTLLPDGLDPAMDASEYGAFFETCFSTMFEECSRKSIGYEQVCQNLLQSVLLVILRIINSTSNAFDPMQSDSLAQKVKLYIDQNYARKITIRDIAQELHISYFHLSHMFKDKLLISPQSYLITCRMTEACRLLANTDLSIHEICQRIGYNNQSHFNAQFKAFKDLSPSEYRKLFQMNKAFADLPPQAKS